MNTDHLMKVERGLPIKTTNRKKGWLPDHHLNHDAMQGYDDAKLRDKILYPTYRPHNFCTTEAYKANSDILRMTNDTKTKQKRTFKVGFP